MSVLNRAVIRGKYFTARAVRDRARARGFMIFARRAKFPVCFFLLHRARFLKNHRARAVRDRARAIERAVNRVITALFFAD